MQLLKGTAMRKNFGNETIVTPLPVLIIATYDANGVPNAMNAAWGGQSDYHEVTFYLGSHKTTDNLQITKAFTLSFADKKNLVVADYFGIESGRKVNKIEKAGVSVVKSQFVNAPIIEEFPLTLECKVTEISKTASGEFRVTGEVVNMSADETILDEQGKIDLGKLEPLSYDPANHSYRVLGNAVGQAFHDGLKIRNI